MNPAGRVQDKVALVVGAASGIGRASAELLATHGATVARADLTPGDDLVSLDVTDEARWEAVLADLRAAHGRLDVLVQSAGISHATPVAELALADWRRVLAVNLDGMFLGIKHALPAMREHGGSIVLISSVSGLKASPGASAYCVSKAGVCMLARVAAKECLDAGLAVRVNAICPGGVKTPLWETMPFFRELMEKTGSAEAAFREMAGDKPADRFAEPGEIAEAVLFLASDESRFITGTDLILDNGYTA